MTNAHEQSTGHFASLLLLRHGQSTWNVEHRWAGGANPPLSAEGRASARSIADQLARLALAGLVSSALMRARETAEIIAERLGFDQVVVDSRLNERAAG